MITRFLITNPLALLVSFMSVLVSGEHIGGFYFIYLLLGIVHATDFSVLGLSGILLLMPALLIATRKQANAVSVLSVGGTTCMLLSLSMFFFNDEQVYNIKTFYQIIPFCTALLFCLLAVIFLLGNIRGIIKPRLMKK